MGISKKGVVKLAGKYQRALSRHIRESGVVPRKASYSKSEVILIFSSYPLLPNGKLFTAIQSKNESLIAIGEEMWPDKMPKTGRAIQRQYLLDKAASDNFLNSYAWRKLRYQALQLHGRRCMCCGATPETGAVMNVDHIKPRKTHPELALYINNLQILCGDCNHGKGNWDETDFRMKHVAKPDSVC